MGNRKQLFKLLVEADKEENKIILNVEADIDKLKEYILPIMKAASAAGANIPLATVKFPDDFSRRTSGAVPAPPTGTVNFANPQEKP